MSNQSDREEFVASIQREYPENAGVADVCRRLMRASATHHLYSERDCSDEHWCNDPASERKSELLEKRISGICGELPGMEPIFSGDPRGATVKLKVPSGQTDDWGQVGICIPAGNG